MRDNPEPIALVMKPEEPDTKAGLQNSVDWLERDRTRIAGEHEDLRIRVIKLHKELKELRSEHGRRYGELEKQRGLVDDRDKEIARLNTSIDLLKREHKGYQDAMDHALRVALGKR